MKRLIAVLLFAATAIVGCAGHGPESGWVTLIDGDKGLENFDRIGDVNWRAEGGAIVGDKGKGGHLVTKKSYKDFEIYAKGPNVTVKFNGHVTVHMVDDKFASGPFTLQFGNGPKDAPGGAIKWRKVQVREL
jgi:hypothetical protein